MTRGARRGKGKGTGMIQNGCKKGKVLSAHAYTYPDRGDPRFIRERSDDEGTKEKGRKELTNKRRKTRGSSRGFAEARRIAAAGRGLTMFTFDTR